MQNKQSPDLDALGKEPGSVEFKKQEQVPNPDHNPTQDKAPVELPGKEAQGDQAILGDQSTTQRHLRDVSRPERSEEEPTQTGEQVKKSG